jgi:endonuclease/exonuclease/phosphatase (EEP) superfamily protein YafD
MMRVVVKVLGFAVAAWAVLGFVFRDHPLLGTLYLGLRVPLLLVCFLLGGWAVRQHSLRLVGLVLLGLALLFAPWLHAVLVRASPVEMARNGTPVRVLTANVMAQGGDPVLVLEAVHGHPCDLCFFQEVTPEWKARLEKEGVLRPLHRECRGTADGGQCMFSRWPLRNVSMVGEPGGAEVALCAVVDLPGTELAACGVRLSPPFSRPDLWEAAEHFTLNGKRRSAQWELVVKHLGSLGEGRHRLVAGDLSTLEWEPLYAQARQLWTDGYRRARWGYGATWPARDTRTPFPLVRWDYVWLGPTLDATDAEVIPLSGSDHRALYVMVQP